MKAFKPNRAEATLPASPAHYQGDVRVQTLVPASEQNDVEVLAVFFTDGGRTIPHIHSIDQLLVVVDGRCIVATQTGRIGIGKGESAFIPKGEWHWHGAVKGTNACHYSIKKAGPTEWVQPLYDYNER